MGIALLLALAVAADQPKTTQRVELDGKTYRVTVKGREVEAADKSLFTKRDPERGDKLRQAVRSATGCDMRDGYWEGAKMRGILDCTPRAPTAAPPG